MITIKKYLFFILISFFLNNISLSDTISISDPTTDEPKAPVKTSDYDLAKKYILKADKYDNKNKSKKATKFYNKALKLLHSSNKEYEINANIFYNLGYVNQKLRNLENAEIYYLLGLEIDPKHNKINKNLGELYVNLNKSDKANERLKVLKNCNCEEFKSLNDLVKLSASK